MKARLPESLLGRGTNEQPLHKTSEASASDNHLEPAGPVYLMGGTLEICGLFASTTAKKLGAANPLASAARDSRGGDLSVSGDTRTLRFLSDRTELHRFVPSRRQNRSGLFLCPLAREVSVCCWPSQCIRPVLWLFH